MGTPRVFPPRLLPTGTPSLADGVPTAPAGTIFVRSARSGYCVPPMHFLLHFGRATEEVHVPVGLDDPYVSRRQGVFACNGDRWMLRNHGKRPIRLPNGKLVLNGHEVPMGPGYTPLGLETPHCAAHLLEVFVVGRGSHRQPCDSSAMNTVSAGHILGDTERLVVTILAQRYLRQDPYPQPASWKQVAEDLNFYAPHQRQWTPKAAENIVALLRKRLATGTHPVPGLLREEGIAEPVGAILSHNLIMALLTSGTLSPADLVETGLADE